MDSRDVVTLLRGWRGASALLRQRSLIEGVWNGRRGWLAVAAVVWGARGLRKAVHRDEKLLLRERLRPGEQLVISEPIVRPTRRQRRKAAKRPNRS
jgi:hypothetical protein